MADILAVVVTFNELNSDCMAQKGFTIDKINFGGDADSYVYVVNTHLDAGNSSGDAAARASQLVEIRDAINNLNDPSHPVLITGDLNVVGDDVAGSSEYSNMIRTLGVTDLFRVQFPSSASQPGFTFDNQVNAYAFNWADGAGGPTRMRLDYFLVRQGTQFRIDLNTSAQRTISVQNNSPAVMPSRTFDTRLCRDPGPPTHGWLIDNPSLR